MQSGGSGRAEYMKGQCWELLASVMNYSDFMVPRLVASVSRLVHHLFRLIRQK